MKENWPFLKFSIRMVILAVFCLILLFWWKTGFSGRYTTATFDNAPIRFSLKFGFLSIFSIAWAALSVRSLWYNIKHPAKKRVLHKRGKPLRISLAPVPRTPKSP